MLTAPGFVARRAERCTAKMGLKGGKTKFKGHVGGLLGEAYVKAGVGGMTVNRRKMKVCKAGMI